MSSIKVLLVEDELNFGSVLSQFLKLNDFEVVWVQNGKEAWSLIKTGRAFDCCVLDIMMPEMDGLSLAKEIKASRPTLPFVFLTAKSMKEDMIEGFRSGAVDYITKPFDSELLVYKLKALLRSSTIVSPKMKRFEFGAILYDAARRTISCSQKEERLSPKENEILLCLVQKIGEVVSREEIVSKVWQEDNYFNRRSMDVYMTKLRKHLKCDPSIALISLHAGGYVLEIQET